MRGSGVLLLVLVFGHLFVNLMLGEGIHAIDFAFVAGKWANPFWQVWDLAMLWLALLHGMNGLRTIINDYATKPNTALRAQDAAVLLDVRGPGARHAGDLHLRPVHRPELDARRLPDPVRDGHHGSAPQVRRRHRRGRRGRHARRPRVRTAHPHGGPHQALPDPLPHRRRPGRHVRRAGQRRGGQLGVAHLRHRQGRRLPRRPGRGRGDGQARPSTRCSTSRRWACPSTAPTRARSTSAGSAGTPATTARPPYDVPASRPTAPAT